MHRALGGVELGAPFNAGGGIVSITFGTGAGSSEQIGLVPPGVHTPNV
jgi:hypothetical protein